MNSFVVDLWLSLSGVAVGGGLHCSKYNKEVVKAGPPVSVFSLKSMFPSAGQPGINLWLLKLKAWLSFLVHL